MRILAAGGNLKNEAYSLVSEFFIRKTLYKLGFMASDLKHLDADKAMRLILISNELDKIKSEAEKKAIKKGK